MTAYIPKAFVFWNLSNKTHFYDIDFRASEHSAFIYSHMYAWFDAGLPKIFPLLSV